MQKRCDFQHFISVVKNLKKLNTKKTSDMMTRLIMPYLLLEWLLFLLTNTWMSWQKKNTAKVHSEHNFLDRF